MIRQVSSASSISDSGKKSKKSSSVRYSAFEFVAADIKEIIPVVKHMHQLDYFEGRMLAIYAQQIEKQHGGTDNGGHHMNTVSRLNAMSLDRLHRALKAVPDDMNTRLTLAEAYQNDGLLAQRLEALRRRGESNVSLATCADDEGVMDADEGMLGYASSPRHQERYKMFRLLKHEDSTRCCNWGKTQRGGWVGG